MADTFLLKTKEFEGPIELLLALIERKKLHINDISLAEVADEYMVYIQEAENIPIDTTAHFITTASTLLLIKSLSLLPTLAITEDEQGSIDELKRRLRLYQLYKERTKDLEKLWGTKPLFLAQTSPANSTVFFAPSSDIRLDTLRKTITHVLEAVPTPQTVTEAIVKVVVSLEEVIQNLTDRIKTSIRMSFNEFAGKDSREKINVIVSFLALLELVKQGTVRARQTTPHHDIEIETQDYGTPHYT